ncbi:uncharacterized protein LOC124421324 isoform X1 [Lucilia cuprina]|uniref:uncharacterized protein LOC124421324 isoform X1 n=1 Tax=Lucilia cuprina TaxID=7375 RepID=UPI001F06A0DF|nr:uncharacterized protein LOC124421324 isoform X1 [Lucilia cuprina]
MLNMSHDDNFKYIPNATTITNERLDMFPNVKFFFEMLVKDTKIESKHVGRSFRYDESVEKNRYFSAHGLFMDYFIRKHLSNQYNIKIKDMRTEIILENSDNFFIRTDEKLQNAIKEHYEIYKDSNTKAMDIIKSIKTVSQSHLIYFGDDLPKIDYTVNENNLREIIRYLERLPYSMVHLNPNLGCNYFNADADLIFDNDVIYEIKTSKFKSLTRDEFIIPSSKFYQTIIYGFGFYKLTGIKVKRFKIYNPLLGDEYSIELDNIDFELFEKVLKRDVAIYSRYKDLIINEMIFDFSLFNEVKDETKKKK